MEPVLTNGEKMKHHKQQTSFKKLFGLLLAPLMLCAAIIPAVGVHAASYEMTVNVEENPDLIQAGSFIAYCLQNGLSISLNDYVDSSETVPKFDEMSELVSRAYPVYSGPALGVIYLNDATYTDLEAQLATQVAIWTIENPAATRPYDARVIALADAMVAASAPTLKANWVSIDAAAAVITDLSDTHSSFGPIAITIDTGNTNLDAAIRNVGLKLSPEEGSRDPNFVFSASSKLDGEEATKITDGSYYLHFKNSAGIDDTLSFYSPFTERQLLSSFTVAEATVDITPFQLIGVVKATPIDKPSVIVKIEGEKEPEVCPTDPTLPIDDPKCNAPEVPETGFLSENPTLVASGITLAGSVTIVVAAFVTSRIKSSRTARASRITRIRRK